jgi:hypothetical protein
VSKSNVDKKARRKKRLASRNDRWLSPDAHAEVEGVARIANVIIPRGWVFDAESSSGDVISWYYPPSGVETDADSIEPVTRIWLNNPAEPNVLLVGTGEDADDVVLTVEALFARLDAIEAHRLADSVPAADQ